jgi:uncharacterized DUF497 family protein
MDFEWDEAKSEWNRVHRGFGFEIVTEFDWAGCVVEPSARGNELRFLAVGRGPSGLMAIVWARRNDKVRIISVRRVHQKEARDRGFEET